MSPPRSRRRRRYCRWWGWWRTSSRPPILAVWEMELGELYRWTDEAGSLVRRIYGSPRRRR